MKLQLFDIDQPHNVAVSFVDSKLRSVIIIRGPQNDTVLAPGGCRGPLIIIRFSILVPKEIILEDEVQWILLYNYFILIIILFAIFYEWVRRRNRHGVTW